MNLLLIGGVALFILPLLLIAVYARRVEKRQRERLVEVQGGFGKEKIA